MARTGGGYRRRVTPRARVTAVVAAAAVAAAVHRSRHGADEHQAGIGEPRTETASRRSCSIWEFARMRRRERFGVGCPSTTATVAPRPQPSSTVRGRSRRASAPPSRTGLTASATSSAWRVTIRGAAPPCSTSGSACTGRVGSPTPGGSGGLRRSQSRTRQYAIRVGDLLHPEYPVPGLPTMSPASRRRHSRPYLQSSSHGSSETRGRAARARRSSTGSRSRTPSDRPVAAARAFDAAAKAAAIRPGGADRSRGRPVRQGRPVPGVSRLGPLGRSFPHAATVRFHPQACCSCGWAASRRRVASSASR